MDAHFLTEKETIRDNSRLDEGKITTKGDLVRSQQGDLNCEEAIIKDKERFGRVRKSMMTHLRGTYGEQIANRALWRVNKRMTEGYLNS